MTEADAIDAIRVNHLAANVAHFEEQGRVLRWDEAWIDPGNTIFGPGPYAKVPVDDIVVRVYPTERTRRRLIRSWGYCGA